MSPDLSLSQIVCILFSINFQKHNNSYLANFYLLNVNNGNTTKICEKCSKLTIKTPERLH